MNVKRKKLMIKISTSFFALLLFVAATLFIYANSPLYPANITDKTIIEKGTEYTIKIRGITEYDENSFSLAMNGFYFTSGKSFVVVDDEGFANTTDSEESGVYVLGKFNSADIIYDKYIFCGQKYKTQEEIEAFFDTPDPIYNFDFDKISYYISDIIQYEKKFYGTATLKLYKGRCVITSVSIGDEKVLEYKNSF